MEIKIDETYHVASFYCPYEDYFSQKLRVRIKDNKNSPHGKFHRFLFPFSSKFSDVNFASYILYIYLCYVTFHTQWARVTRRLMANKESNDNEKVNENKQT